MTTLQHVDELDNHAAISSLPPIQSLRDLWKFIAADDKEVKLNAITLLRRFLCLEESPIDETVAAGVIPSLIEGMRCSDWPLMQNESTWTLANIASSDKIENAVLLFDAGICEAILQSIASPIEQIVDNTLFLIANLTAPIRSRLIEMNILPPLIRLAMTDQSQDIAKSIARVLSHLCLAVDSAWSVFSSVLPALARLLRYEDAARYATSALTRMTKGHNMSHINAIITVDGLLEALFELTLSKDARVVLKVVEVLANITTGNKEQILRLIDKGILVSMSSAWGNTDKTNIRTMTAKALANICSVADSKMFGEVINCGIIKYFMAEPPKVKGQYIELLWALTHASFIAHSYQIEYLINGIEMHSFFINALTLKLEDDIILAVLEGLENTINKVTENSKKTLRQIRKLADVTLRQLLTKYDNPEIQQKANILLQNPLIINHNT